MHVTSDLKESAPTLNYSVIFNFEAEFDPTRSRQWILEHRHQTFYIAGVYLLLIFGIHAWMKNRSRLELKNIVTAWNISLAAFSIFGLCRTLPELLYQLNKFGFTHSVCDPNFVVYDKVTAFWTWAMVISKIAELGDTLWIVFRKHQIIVLHWYHHLIAVFFFWYAYSEHAAFLRWVIVMNFCAHSLMYTYYAVSAMRICRIPRAIAITVTVVQIIQLIIGNYVCYTIYKIRKSHVCEVPEYVLIAGWFTYLSLLILFTWFFYKTYLSPKKNGKKLK